MELDLVTFYFLKSIDIAIRYLCTSAECGYRYRDTLDSILFMHEILEGISVHVYSF
jgi:hypothetical protein